MATINRRTTLLVLIVHVIPGLLLLAPRYIRPDSIGVVSWIRSLLVDGDFVFFDEWAGFGMVSPGFPHFKEVTEVGALANHWWPGAGVLSSPFYLVSHLLSLAIPGSWFSNDGFFGLDLFTLGWCSVLFGAVCSLLTWSLIEDLYPGDRSGRVAAIALLLTWVGTPLFWYVYRMPLGTHAAGVLTVGLFTVLGARQLMGRDVSGLLIGLVFGLAALTRLQHAALLFVLIWIGVRTRRSRRFWVEAGFGVALPAAIQGIGWWAIYGNPLGPLVAGSAEGGATWLPFYRFAIAPVLVSPWHGLLSWSPVVLFSMVGWVVISVSRPDADSTTDLRPIGWMLVLIFGVELLVNATMDRYWWGGLSFGSRRFVDLALPFALGIAGVLATRWGKWLVGPAVLAAGWSCGLMISAEVGRLDLSHYVGWSDLARAAVISPWSARLIEVKSPLGDAGAVVLLLAALVLTAIVSGVVWKLGSRIGPARVATAWLAILVVMFSVGGVMTRIRAVPARDRMGFDTPAARIAGPLIDQSSLVAMEIEWLEATHRLEEARADREERSAIDGRLRSVGVELRGQRK